MTTYFISDLHLGHARVIELTGRPFADVAEMNEALVERWNNVVGDADTVFVVGDLAMGKLEDSMHHAAMLRGRKLLVPGNHDRCWSGNRRVRPRDVAVYEDAGFEIANEQVWCDEFLVCHFPYEGDSHDADRFDAHRPVDEGAWLIHGHVHEKWRVNGRQVNVSVEVRDYTPVALDEIRQEVGMAPCPSLAQGVRLQSEISGVQIPSVPRKPL